jgi:hypothetical protein
VRKRSSAEHPPLPSPRPHPRSKTILRKKLEDTN